MAQKFRIKIHGNTVVTLEAEISSSEEMKQAVMIAKSKGEPILGKITKVQFINLSTGHVLTTEFGSAGELFTIDFPKR